MEEAINKLYPQFIKNTICGDDLFEGKSHEDIAKSISSIIRHNDTTNVIGIDGGWGSGKSNLVCLIEKELQKNDQSENLIKYKFFNYDAWGHQEDFQRRSILEELIDSLTDKNLPILQEKWKEKLESLLAKKRKKKTETVPKLGVGFIVGVLILILTPIFKTAAEWLPDSCTWGKFIITILPFVVGATYGTWRAWHNLKKRREKTNLGSILIEMFLIYKDEVKANTTYENISESEPSSREFKKWMREIDNDLGNCTLVVVFDNMDRLPKQKVQELWATIHTFFADVKYQNIKVIVPFDRTHIISAFKNEDSYVVKENNPNHSNAICYGDDYINKTFDVIYRVSPPTMSNWKNYFTLKWEDAFGNAIELDSQVMQIFDNFTLFLTPRKVIAFINEFVTIKQMAYAINIPDRYIALFIFAKSKISENPDTEVLKPSYLFGAVDFIFKNDDELPKFISALYYQLLPEKALDVIYIDRLKRALDENDSKFISEIKDSTSFRHLLDKSITEVINITNAVLALKENEKCNVKNWDCLYRKLILTKNESTTHNNLQFYQKVLLEKVSDTNKYLQSIICDFYSGDTIEDAMSFHTDITILSDLVGNDKPYKYLRAVEIEPAHFINFIKKAKDKWKNFKINCDKNKFQSHLETLTVEDINDFDIAKYIKDDFKLSTYKEHLEELIDTNASDTNNLNILYTRLKEVDRPTSKILPDSDLYSIKSTLSKDNTFYYDLVCMRMSRFNNFHSSYTPYFAEDLNNIDEIFVEKVAEKIESYIHYGSLLLGLQGFDTPLYIAVVKKITEKSFGQSSMNIEKILPSYENITSKLDIDPQILIKRLDAWSGYVTSKITKNNLNTIPILFFTDVINEKIDNGLAKHCLKTADEYLNIKTKDEWKEAIKDESYDFSLLKTLQPKISQNCFDALRELLKEYADGSISSLNKKTVDSVFEIAKKSNRKFNAIFQNIRDSFIAKVNISPELFEFFGEWLFEYAKLETNSNSLRTIFSSDIVEMDKCLELMLKYRPRMIEIVKKAGGDADDFKDKILYLVDNNSSSPIADFEGFANSIGVYRTETELE